MPDLATQYCAHNTYRLRLESLRQIARRGRNLHRNASTGSAAYLEDDVIVPALAVQTQARKEITFGQLDAGNLNKLQDFATRGAIRRPLPLPQASFRVQIYVFPHIARAEISGFRNSRKVTACIYL
jgi:hypothetical protein